MKIKLLTVVLAALATCCFSPLSAAFIVNDSFEDGDRSIHRPPEGLAYYTSQATSTLIEEGGILTLLGNSNRFLLAAVTEPGEFISLNDGEAISLEIKFRLSSGGHSPAKQFRIAWLKSKDQFGDSRIVAKDSFGALHSELADCRGYQAAVSLMTPGEGAKPINLFKRNREHRELLMLIKPDVSAYQMLGAGGVGAASFDDSNTVQLNIRRIGKTAEISLIFFPGDPNLVPETEFYHRVIDADTPVFHFDYFAIGLNASDKSIEQLEIESLRVFKAQ